MGKMVGQTGFLSHICQPAKEKENSDFKLVKLCLKIELGLHPAHEVG